MFCAHQSLRLRPEKSFFPHRFLALKINLLFLLAYYIETKSFHASVSIKPDPIARPIQTRCEITFPVTLRISCHLFLTLYAVNKYLLAEDHKQSYNLCASIFHMSSQERYLSMTSFHLIHFPVSSALQSFYPPPFLKNFILFLPHPFFLHPFESFLCAALVSVAQQ